VKMSWTRTPRPAAAPRACGPGRCILSSPAWPRRPGARAAADGQREHDDVQVCSRARARGSAFLLAAEAALEDDVRRLGHLRPLLLRAAVRSPRRRRSPCRSLAGDASRVEAHQPNKPSAPSCCSTTNLALRDADAAQHYVCCPALPPLRVPPARPNTTRARTSWRRRPPRSPPRSPPCSPAIQFQPQSNTRLLPSYCSSITTHV
jgi:hypothetical protein